MNSIDFAEGPRRKCRLAMVDGTEHQIGGALEGRAFRRDAGRHTRLADQSAIGLGVFVQAVAAQGQERGSWRHLAVAVVEPAQERPLPIELVVEAFVPGEHAVVRNAAQHGMADFAAATVPDEVADRIAAARIADQRDARRSGAVSHGLDGLGKLAALVLGRGMIGLRHRVVTARQRIGEVDRDQPVRRNPVGLHPPQRGHPQGGVVAVAMHEQDRRHFRRAGCRRRILGERLSAKAGGRQHPGAPEDRSSRQVHLTASPCLSRACCRPHPALNRLATGQPRTFAGISSGKGITGRP